MLADKFNRYKLMLMISVSSAVVFHTLLLQVDARVLPVVSTVANNTTADFPAHFYCSRTGIFLHIGNESCPPGVTEKWLAVWKPANCRPVACAQQSNMRMRWCSSTEKNCTQITSKSTAVLSLELVLEFESIENEETDCKVPITSITTEHSIEPSIMLCNCLIQCPVVLTPPSEREEINNSTLIELKELERQKHNRGFWIYFFLRIMASGSLATSFSM